MILQEVVPIPIPIYSNGGGEVDPHRILALLIVLNGVIIIWFILSLIVNIFTKQWDFMDIIYGTESAAIRIFFFGFINALALIGFLVVRVADMLQ